MAVSLKAVHRISGRKKVFPRTFLSELSGVISECIAFSFCKYVKTIFLELKTIIARKRLNLSVARTKFAYIVKLAAQRPPNLTEKCYYPYIKWSFKGKKCSLLLIYTVFRGSRKFTYFHPWYHFLNTSENSLSLVAFISQVQTRPLKTLTEFC